MRLFRNRNQKAVNPRQEKLAAGIAGKIISWQRKTADHLNGQAAGLSPKGILLLLILFCVLFAAVNLYLLIHSI
jgi:hypothetical protein